MLKYNYTGGHCIFAATPGYDVHSSHGSSHYRYLGAYDVYYADPLASIMSSLEFQSEPMDILSNMGHPDLNGQLEVSIFGFPPATREIPPRVKRLDAGLSVFRFLTGSSPDPKVDMNEHSTGHFNLVGEVYEGLSVSRGAFETPVRPLPQYISISDTGSVSFSGNSPAPLPALTADQFMANYHNDVYSDLQAGSTSNGIEYRVTDVEAYHLPSGAICGIAYTLVNANPYLPPSTGDGITPYAQYAEIRIGWGILFSFYNPVSTTSSVLWQRVNATGYKAVKLVRGYNRGYGEAPSWYNSSGFDAYPAHFTGNVFRLENLWVWAISAGSAYGWDAYSGISPLNPGVKVNTGLTSFLQFRHDVEPIKNDLLPVAFLAQVDAYESNARIMDSNILEFLTEVSEISDLIRNPFEMIRHYSSKLGKQGLSIRDVIDMYTNADLYYHFMLKPSFALAKEASAKASRLSKVFNTFFGWQTANGKSFYEIVESDNYAPLTGCTVIGRSKMRYRVPSDLVWSVVVPLEKLHVLPNMSTYWETLRLSFVVDWFFNVQSKLDVIDKTVAFMALEMGQTVNSVTLYKPVDSSVTFSHSKETAYKYYARYVLKSFQPFSPTRFGVVAGHGVPSWLTAGSLFYKLTQ